METIKVAVIGAGSMGREHIKAFYNLPQVKVVGLLSRTYDKAQKLAQEFQIPVVAKNVEDLYKQTHAELVIIAVPELEANHIAKQAFLLDWAILMEKPAGYDLQDANDIAQAARLVKKPVLVGFNRRFYTSTTFALQDVNSRSQERRFIHIQDQQSFAEARRYNHPEKVVEKFMYANSIHMIDLLRMFGRDEVTKVESVLPWQGEQTEIVLISIEFKSGDKGLYEGLWKGPGPWACTICTPSKRLVLQPVETIRYQNLNERQLHEVELDPVDKQYKAGFYRQAQEVINCLQGKPNQAVTIEESLKTMKLIHSMFQV